MLGAVPRSASLNVAFLRDPKDVPVAAACNAVNTSACKCTSDKNSCIRYWAREAGHPLSQAIKCSYAEDNQCCQKSGKIGDKPPTIYGGHVWGGSFRNGTFTAAGALQLYIIPLCPTHNGPSYHGKSFYVCNLTKFAPAPLCLEAAHPGPHDCAIAEGDE